MIHIAFVVLASMLGIDQKREGTWCAKIVVSNDRKTAFLCGMTGTKGFVKSLQTDSLGSEIVTKLDEACFAIAVDQLNQAVFAGGEKGSAYILDYKMLQAKHVIHCSDTSIRDICVISKSMIALACTSGSIVIVDVDKRMVISAFKLHAGEAFCIKYIPEDKAVVSGGADGMIYFTSIYSGKVIRSIHSTARSIRSLDIYKNFLYVVGDESDFEIWELGELLSARLLYKDTPHRSTILSVVADGLGKNVLLTGMDGTVTLFDTATKTSKNLHQHDYHAIGALFIADTLLSADVKGMLFRKKID